MAYRDVPIGNPYWHGHVGGLGGAQAYRELRQIAEALEAGVPFRDEQARSYVAMAIQQARRVETLLSQIEEAA